MKIYENLDISNLEGEIWKIIKNFPSYQVSNLGRIKSLKFGKEKILRQSITKEYLKVRLYKNKKSYNTEIHRLVYETFKNKLKNNYIVHHINENKKDNFIDNLKQKLYLTHIIDHHIGKKHSNKTKYKMSMSKKGKDSPNRKLIVQDIIQIELLLKEGKLIQQEIADIFGVCKKTIYIIKKEKNYFGTS